MNKKRLSVVMAGAMLATSVAPVLAANQTNDVWELDTTTGKEYEVNGSNRGILVKELRELLLSKVYADVGENKEVKINADGTKVDVRNTSVYEVQLDGNVYNQVTEAGIKAMEDAINNAAAGKVIRVIDRGSVKVGNKYYIEAQEDIKTETELTYATKADLEAEVTWFNANKAQAPAVESMRMEGDTLVVITRFPKDELDLKKIELKVGSKQLNFTEPIDENNKILTDRTVNSDWNDLAGFNTDKNVTTVKKGYPIDGKVLADIKISDVDSKEIVKLSDLYDGLLLTTKGQELLATLKEYPDTTTGLKDGIVATAIEKSKNGIFTFDIKLVTYSAKKDGSRDKVIEKKLITVSSNNKDQLELFRKWMYNRKPQVDVLAGDNRYETAVKVAKENADITTVAENGNIVLVNGNALVDGLAAAPLASSVWNKNVNGQNYGHLVAPILLTESDSLPKATKDYIKELIKEQRIKDLDKVTVYLVGGEAVISRSLENQLKEYGLRVVRAGGANREETSLKVAEVMLKDGNKASVDVANPFIVGAEGEADAMSIAPVAAGAAATVKRVRPIIVESNKGLSEKALETIKDWKNDEYDTKAISATIVGGKNVVSKSTEELLKENNVIVDRVEGSNRQATNAAVINRYYKDASVKQLVVSKDGQKNKSELIDALTATSLAVKHNTPIVLGTNKLSEVQVNALNRKATRTGIYVYQVGHGVARNVLKTIADRVGLAK